MASRPQPFTLGTLSFARCRSGMMLKAAERTRLILAACDAYAPDLLVTAGYAVHRRKQLFALAHTMAVDERRTLVVTEVHHDGRRQREPGRGHAMWAVEGDGTPHRMGRQAFATGRDVRIKRARAIDRLRGKVDARQFEVGDLTGFALICGELNIVQGREHPRFADAGIGEAILAADLVVNPTHDRMSNAGTLAAKRRYLSQPHPDGRPRLYVSVSNWEACGLNGRVQYPSPTLHTVYRSGQPQAYEELADGAFGFVFRRWRIDLAGSG